MHALAVEKGVEFLVDTEVTEILASGKKASAVVTSKGTFKADVIVGAGDYHYIDQHLVPKPFRNYTESYWDKRVMAPSCLLYYVGVNKKLPNLQHHNLFFESDSCGARIKRYARNSRALL